jgi:hypothetical protein
MSMATQRWFYGCSVRFASVETLAFRPRTRAKRPLPQAFGSRARGIFTDAHLAKN